MRCPSCGGLSGEKERELKDAMEKLRHMAERDRRLTYTIDRKDAIALLDEVDYLRGRLARAAYICEHLFGMIDAATWREQGGDDGQGHYEGDYYAEQVYTEIQQLQKIAKRQV